MSEFSFQLPDLGEGIVESEVSKWHIQVGDYVEQDQHIADIQTDKAIIETSAPVSGKVLKLGCDEGGLLAVGSTLVLFETNDSPSNDAPQQMTDSEANIPANPQTQKAQPKPEKTVPSNKNATVLTSPSVRLRARQHNINLHTISGSGPKGRIIHSDLDILTSKQDKTHSATTSNTKPAGTPSSTTAAAPGSPAPLQPSKTYTLKGTRRLIANKLQASAQQIPHYSYIEEVDATLLEQERERLNKERTTSQSKLTILPFIIQALVKSLPQFPHCNAHLDNDSYEVHEFECINVGIATMTDNGLMVPVLKQCENLNVWRCADGITQLANAARNNSINSEQLKGSTITLTSLGKLGGIASTPIINAPETCIIGINKIQQRPMVIDNAIAIRSVMNISASFDHRVVDGFDGASLIQALKKHLENPAAIIAQVS